MMRFKRKIDLTFISDWILTRCFRIKEKVLEILYRLKLIDRIPPDDLDLTSMLDRADQQNKWSDLFKK
jgi:hypothetical protein